MSHYRSKMLPIQIHNFNVFIMCMCSSEFSFQFKLTATIQSYQLNLLFFIHFCDIIPTVLSLNNARSRPVVTVNAQLILMPRILNPEDKSCRMPNSDNMVTWWVSTNYLSSASYWSILFWHKEWLLCTKCS